jgi:TrmH family RNA methyltransferase
LTDPAPQAERRPVISSPDNDTVKLLAALRRGRARREHGLFLLEGRRLLREALLRGAEIEKIFVCPESAGEEWDFSRPDVAVQEVSPAVMRKISALETPPGVAALARIRRETEIGPPAPGEIVLAADNIRDPGNLGAILRTALAAGVDKICLTEGTVDLWNPKTVRGAMGVFFSQHILTGLSAAAVVALCREWGALLAVCRMDAPSVFTAVRPLEAPLVLVVGSEGQGVEEEFKAAADMSVAVPMLGGVESLNAAVAAGICLYALNGHIN